MAPAQRLLFTFFLCFTIFLFLGIEVVENSCRDHHPHHGNHGTLGSKKLFVFGDSYAATGNNIKPPAKSWRVPYGITFPGRPSGRYSDGRVFTDFLADVLGLRSPVSFKFRKCGLNNNLKHGMNFAFGGTGVFNTIAPYPNMTSQIDFFELLINDSIFTRSDLQNSIAFVSLVGNDYSTYLSRGGSIQGLPTFISQVVNQLVVDIQRIYNLGVKKVSMTALQPLGCLPRSTEQNSYQKCNDTLNQVAQFHNLLLQQAITKLNNQTTQDHGSPTVIIDLYTAFFTVFQESGTHSQGNLGFANPMKACCTGINQNFTCGSVDERGNQMYNVCQDPKSYFFWDDVHPTQAGWEALTIALLANIDELQRSKLANPGLSLQ